MMKQFQKMVLLTAIVCMAFMFKPLISEKAVALTVPCPTIISVTSVDNTSVTIRWQDMNYPSDTTIEVFDATNNRVYRIAGSCTYYCIQNLTKGQRIEVAVRAFRVIKQNGKESTYYSDMSSSRFVVVGSGANPSIGVNTWSSLQYKENNTTPQKYKFTLTKSGVIQPILYIDKEKPYGSLWNSYVTNSGLTKVYSVPEGDNYSYEDSNGHQWEVQKYERMRLPAGTYYFYFPSDAWDAEYGYFKFKIKYTNESGKSNVEKEFNNSRNTAKKISFNKVYRGNIGCNDKDIDYYKFKLTKKKKVTITMWLPEDTVKHSNYWNICKLVKSSGKVLSNAGYINTVEDSNGKIWDKIRIKKTLKKGTYYVRAAEIYNSSNYKVRITK